ncbi:RNA polymerase sigma factor [Desulfospira joergensenii]|uniref:RNA polymerase sigma factor n=1 Tax=Desulfospira joergensenii TaxID=53329 RepID=UPI0003B5D437|nr:RNA polymerase sigma factor [Desulfospira joergensenii]
MDRAAAEAVRGNDPQVYSGEGIFYLKECRPTEKTKTFDRFYHENKDRVFGFLIRLTGDFHLSFDFMQETFTRYFSRYRDRGYHPALLYTIARNTALDSIRKRREETSYRDEVLSGDGDPESQIIQKQGIDKMTHALQQLAPNDRELIALVAARTFSYKEIGKMLDISEANVKIKVHRARLRLREILGKGGE